jgi:pilus assembly protein TadC
MYFEKKILKRIVNLLPKVYRDSYSKNLFLCGKKTSADYRIGMVILTSLVFSIITIIGSYIFLKKYFIYSLLSIPLFLIIFIVVDYLLLYFLIEKRKEEIEKVMPDFLHLISSNLRAGNTPFQALKASARNEFGPIKEHIDIATSKAIGSESFHKCLSEMANNLNSKVFNRVVNLFVTSMKAGSHMAEVMEETANDIAETRGLKKDLASGTKTYTMFIFFTVIIIAPFLFSVSLYFVDIMSGMNNSSSGDVDSEFDLSLMSGSMDITKEFILTMAIIMIVITAIFSSMLVGVINEGSKKSGLRFALWVVIASVVMLFISKLMIGTLF